MRPIQIPEQSEDHIKAFEEWYRTTRNVRLRTRAPMVLLAAEQHMTEASIAVIVRENRGNGEVQAQTLGFPSGVRAYKRPGLVGLLQR